MPRGDKSKYTVKQKRKAEHIEEGYEARGTPKPEAERRAWATVNKESGGGNLSGSGRGVPDTNVSSEKGGRIGGARAAQRPAKKRSASAKKAALTRKRNAAASPGKRTGVTRRKRAATSSRKRTTATPRKRTAAAPRKRTTATPRKRNAAAPRARAKPATRRQPKRAAARRPESSTTKAH
jgi:hypothetical protein